jgi:hypothetical protein
LPESVRTEALTEVDAAPRNRPGAHAPSGAANCPSPKARSDRLIRERRTPSTAAFPGSLDASLALRVSATARTPIDDDGDTCDGATIFLNIAKRAPIEPSPSNAPKYRRQHAKLPRVARRCRSTTNQNHFSADEFRSPGGSLAISTRRP